MSIGSNGSVVIADATPANVTYSEAQNTGTMAVYSDRTREIGVPRTLTISHQITGKTPATRQRSLVKLSNAIENPALEGDVETAALHVVFDFPHRIVEKSEISDMLVQMVNLLETANFVDKIANSEV